MLLVIVVGRDPQRCRIGRNDTFATERRVRLHPGDCICCLRFPWEGSGIEEVEC